MFKFKMEDFLIKGSPSAKVVTGHHEEEYPDDPGSEAASFRCSECGQEEESSRGLKRHQRLAHPAALLHPCTNCPYKEGSFWKNKKYKLVHSRNISFDETANDITWI
jgi:hypothetical protein